MLTFKEFSEAWTNSIGKQSKEKSVVGNMKYNSPDDYKKGAKQIGSIGPLTIHAHDTGSGMTVFTHHPQEKTIHHVIHSAEKSEGKDGTSLKFLSAHGRDKSPVRTGDVYKHLIKNNNISFVGTGHSPGAQKMWDKFHDDNDIEVVGRHPSGETIRLNRGDKKYADKKTTDPNEKKIGRMELIARKKLN